MPEVCPKGITQGIPLLGSCKFDRFAGDRSHWCRRRSRKDEAPGAIDQKVSETRIASNVGPMSTSAFPKRSHLNFDLPSDSQLHPPGPCPVAR
jgi:hypothetical protein